MSKLITITAIASFCLLLMPACGSDGDGGDGEPADTGAATGDTGAVEDPGSGGIADVKTDPGGGGEEDKGGTPTEDPGEAPVDEGGSEQDPGAAPVDEGGGEDVLADAADAGEGEDIPVAPDAADVTEPPDTGSAPPTASMEIGPAGGEVELGGIVRFSVPENALLGDEVITVTVAQDLAAGIPFTPVGVLVRFEPEGLRFEEEAKVSFALPDVGLGGLPTADQLSVFWTTPAGAWIAMPTTHADGKLSAPVRHFSGGGFGYVPGPCPDGLVRCFGDCTDTQSNSYACGDCDTICKGTEACIDGTCQCPNGYERCGNLCRKLSSDRRHCGACDNACDDSAECVDSVCKTPECTDGKTACRGKCVDTSSDEGNCGACANHCASGQRCEEGVCKDACSPLEVLCFGEDCAYLPTDPQHCGECGRGCGYNESCVDGECKVVMGACCSEDLECSQMSERECGDDGFQGEGYSCDEVVCCPEACDLSEHSRCADDGTTVVSCGHDEDGCRVWLDTPCPAEKPNCTGLGECVGCDDVCADGCCDGPNTSDCVTFENQTPGVCGGVGEACALCEAPNDVSCQGGVCTCHQCDPAKMISCSDQTTRQVCTLGHDGCAVSSLMPCPENHICWEGACYTTLEPDPPTSCELPKSADLSGAPGVGGGAATFGLLLPGGACALSTGSTTTSVPAIATLVLAPLTNVWTVRAHFDGTEPGESSNGWMVNASSIGTPTGAVSGGEITTVSGFRSVSGSPGTTPFDVAFVNGLGQMLLLNLTPSASNITVNTISVGGAAVTDSPQ
jgi:hypothetical protein